MEWLIFLVILLIFPFAVIKFLFENIGVALIILAIIVLSGILEAMFSD